MNIHPVVVHFPIALLTVYSILEVLRFQFLKKRSWWFYLKAALVIFGSFGTIAALMAGEVAEEAFRGNPAARHIIGIHSDWAATASTIYGVIAAIYLIVFLKREGLLKSVFANQTVARITLWLERMLESWLIVFLALAGLIAITITGALGGSIVYGPHSDPMIELVYRVLKI